MSLYEAARAILDQVPAGNMDLRQAVMEIMNLALKTDEELAGLRRRVRELEDAAGTNSVLILDQGVYWLPDANGPKGPYCPACWGVERKLVPMLTYGEDKDEFAVVCQIHDQARTFVTTPNALRQRTHP